MNMMTSTGYTAKIEMITPKDATRYLGRNTENRRVRPYHVDALVRDHLAGQFVFNGDAIRFFDDGTLADGQHRLQMIVKANKPAQMVVVRGLSRDAMKSIDGGMKRTHGDRFGLAGVQNANRVASTISILHILARQQYAAPKLTPTEAFSVLDTHPDIERAVSHCSHVEFGAISIASAIHYIGYYTGRAEEADEFVEVLKTGSGGPGHPVFAAREKIIRARGGVARMHRDGLIAILCAAWAALIDGKSVSRLHTGTFKAKPHVAGWDVSDLTAREK